MDAARRAAPANAATPVLLLKRRLSDTIVPLPWMVEMTGLSIGGTAGNRNGNVLFLGRLMQANPSLKLYPEEKTCF
jgi:hypothetical protein